MFPAWRIVTALIFVAGTARAQALRDDSLRVQRLAAIGRLWGVVKYFHPAFLARDVPWDSALVATIPRVRAARTTADYSAAVNQMLGVVRDAYTRVRPQESLATDADSATRVTTRATTRWEKDSTLVIRIPCCFAENSRALEAAAPLIESAGRVLFDLRGSKPAIMGEANDEFGAEFGVDLDSRLVHGAIAGPTTRRRMFVSYRDTGADATRATYDVANGIFRGRPGNPSRRVGFLVYADTDLPGVAWALQHARQGVIVLDDAHGERIPDRSSYSVSLGEGVIADVRIAEMLGRPYGGPSPDTLAHRTRSTDAPLVVALTLVRRHGALNSKRAAPEGHDFMPRADSAYSEMRYPALPYRLLATYRYWNAIQYFYFSPMPAGTDWNDVLVENVRAMEAASDSVEYRLAVAAMTVRLHDGHAQSPFAAPYVVGSAGPRIRLQYVEGHAVVTRVMNDSITVASGIKVGDVILRVDGEDVVARMARIERLLPGTSRPGEPNGRPINQLLSGRNGSLARVTVERADGSPHEVALPRTMSPCGANTCPERSGAAIRFLTPEIGYADLAGISESMVDSLFETFRNTRAIVFDGRGPNAGSPPSIASRLSESRVRAGRALGRVVLSPDTATRTTTESTRLLESTTKWRYPGKTVLLINDRAFSNQEQVPIFFASANGTTLVGSPTAGGIGALTFVTVPGGIAPSFPGGEGRPVDGRVIHRIGVQPDILVRPTIAGIRAGRDEVLERALGYLREALLR